MRKVVIAMILGLLLTAGVAVASNSETGNLWFHNQVTGEVRGYATSGAAVVNTAVVNTVSDLNWQIKGEGDLNGDGHTDLVWRNTATGEVYVYFMDSLALVSAGHVRVVGLDWEIVAVEDLDADGIADLMWHNVVTGANYVYYMDGLSVHFEGSYDTVVGTDWDLVAVNSIECVCAPPPVPLRLAVMGDFGDPNAALAATSQMMNVRSLDADSVPYDALITLGDNVYPDGDPALLDQVLWTPFQTTLLTADLYPALGNHDWDYGFANAQMAATGQPSEYYTEVLAPNVRLVVLNSENVTQTQLDWATSTLQAATEEWVIVTMHRPILSYGFYNSDPDVQPFKSILETYGDVDLVMAGHEHDYQRFSEVNGVHYMVAGNAARLRPTGFGPETVVALEEYGYVDLTITDSGIAVKMIGHSQIWDQFTILP